MKKYKIYSKLLLIFVVIAGIFGCTTSEDKSGGGVQVIYHTAETKPQISVYSKYIPVNIGKKQNISINASVIPEAEASSALIYSSSNNAVAAVSNDGTVTVNKAGIAVINIALEKDKSVNNQVIINAFNKTADVENSPAVMAVAVDETYLKIKKGKGLAIFPSVRPGNAVNKELAYLSTNANVAEVKDGFIKAKNYGSAGIIIYSKSNPEKYAFINVDVVNEESSNSGSGSFTAPDGTAPIDLNKDPMSLIAKYQILDYSINGDKAKTADSASSLRVNVNLDGLGAGIVKILMYINLNGREARLIQKKNISNYGSIPDIFTSLGAKITGDYTMEFTLDPVNYTELARHGIVNKGDTLVLNIGKIQAFAPAGGLGSDIIFDEKSVPVEGENTDDSNTETPETPEDNNKPDEIQVKSIKFDLEEFSPVAVNETIQINAEIYPDNAANKTLVWKSSNESVATVNKNGLVTIHKNGSSVITAQSSNGIEAEMQIVPAAAVYSFNLNSDKIELTMNIDAEANISYQVYPEILNNSNHNAEYFADDTNIVSVDNTGKITALSAGETFIRVTINDIVRECHIIVKPEPENVITVEQIVLPSGSEGRYELSLGSFTLETNIIPENASNKRLKYQSSNPQVAEINAAGIVTLKNTGETNITITSSSNPDINAVYKVIVETLPKNVVFERFDYGVAVGETSEIILVYEGSPSNTNTVFKILDNHSIAEVNEKTGAVTGLSSGTALLEAVTENGKKATTIITVYTPVVKGNVHSLQGTYQIIDFSQYNGTLNVGTNDHGGVERMIGEMTIEVNGNNVKIKSKIQMDSSAMNNFDGLLGQGKEEARKGQFQYTEYTEAAYNASGFGTAGKTSAKVTHDNDMLKLYQEWKEMNIATVHVNTWIKKKSDTIKDLKKDYFHWSKNGANYDAPANAVAHHPAVKAPEKEPYYTYGLITK